MSILNGDPVFLKILLRLALGGVFAGAVALAAVRGGGSGGSPTAAVPSTPTAAVEQVMPKGGPFPANRTDCPSGWDTYNDPDGLFSLCYAPGLKPITYKPPTSDIGTSLVLSEPDTGAKPTNTLTLIISWGRFGNFRVGDPSPTTCPTYTGGVEKPTSSEFVPASRFASPNLSGRTAIGCLSKGTAVGAFPVEELTLNIRFAKDDSEGEGYVRIGVTYMGPNFAGTFNRAEQILKTLRLP